MMLRIDHQYPPTRRMPLGPPECRDSDMGELALTLPAPLPPQIEELRPSRPTRCPHPEECAADEVCIFGCVVHEGGLRPTPTDTGLWPNPEARRVYEILKANEVALRALQDASPKPPRRVPWLACVVGAALFALGYWLGKVLP